MSEHLHTFDHYKLRFNNWWCACDKSITDERIEDDE